MKLTFRGRYKTEDQLPRTNLPHNAVKFREPETMDRIDFVSSFFLIPAILLVGLFVLASYLLHGVLLNGPSRMIERSLIGLIILAIMPIVPIIPQELLRVIILGRDTIVELFYAPKLLMVFFASTTPIKKWHFVCMSFLPSLVIGWLPLLVWVVLPPNEWYRNYLFWFSFFSIIHGRRDYMNVYNALRQMPEGSIRQGCGLHSYWYTPEKEASA